MEKRIKVLVAGMMVMSAARLRAQTDDAPRASDLATEYTPGDRAGDVVFANAERWGDAKALDAARAKLYPRAAALDAAGEYLQEVDVRDQIAGYDLLLSATAKQHESGYGACVALEALALRLEGEGRPRDAVRVLRLALELQRRSPKLYEKRHLFATRLQLAHALAASGDTAGAAQVCSTTPADDVPRSEVSIPPNWFKTHTDEVGSRRVLEGRREMFCGNERAGRNLLDDELRAHPDYREIHHIFADEAQTHGHWVEAAAERKAWLH